LDKKLITIEKNGSYLEKGVTLGKKGYPCKNVPHLEKWVTLRKVITLGKIYHTGKKLITIEKNGSYLETLVTLE